MCNEKNGTIRCEPASCRFRKQVSYQVGIGELKRTKEGLHLSHVACHRTCMCDGWCVSALSHRIGHQGVLNLHSSDAPKRKSAERLCSSCSVLAKYESTTSKSFQLNSMLLPAHVSSIKLPSLFVRARASQRPSYSLSPV